MLERFKSAVRTWVGPEPGGDRDPENLGGIAIEYSARVIADATNNFSQDRRLGSGAAGAVYHGYLHGGTEVAVKVIKNTGQLAGFEDEVKVLSRFRHPNLVMLLGWGQGEDGDRYLVYELLSGGDVEKRLQKAKKGQEPFPWNQRISVALDAACGLSYMVNSQPKAFHRDIKPPNILLDGGGTAKMADFGLARHLQEVRKGHLTVDNISGTPGYACPAYVSTGKVSETSEVYSFGTVLLELIMNEPPALCGPGGDIIYPLMQRVQPAAPGADDRVMSNLDTTAQWPPQVIAEFVKLSLQCVARPERRPLFEEIVTTLRQLNQASTSLHAPLGPPMGSIGPARQQGQMWPGAGAPALQPPPVVQHQPLQAERPQPGQSGPRRYSANASAAPPRPSAGQGASAPANGGANGYEQTLPPAAAPIAGYGSQAQPNAIRRNSSGMSSATYSSTDATEAAEIVFECIHADGVEYAAIPDKHRAIAFRVESSGGMATIGRGHQPEFFHSLVAQKDRLTAISRAHFQVMWERGSPTLMLRKLSANPLLLNDRMLPTANETVPIQDGMKLGFSGVSEGAFLELRLIVRSRSTVASKGPHPAISTTPASPPTPPAAGGNAPLGDVQMRKTVAPQRTSPDSLALICTNAAGIDVSKLQVAQRIIEIPLDSDLQIGKHHQVNFFENLLTVEPKWLSFISRSHCRVKCEREEGRASSNRSNRSSDRARSSSRPPLSLKVENLSLNVVLVGNSKVPKDMTETIAEGGTFAFVAAPQGREERFLEFVFQRMPAVGGG